jgi:hypothetical protein
MVSEPTDTDAGADAVAGAGADADPEAGADTGRERSPTTTGVWQPARAQRRGSGADRAQAFTIEGLSAALVVTAALVFSLQAVVVTPTTRGTVDEDVRSELRQEATDVLTVTATADPDDLSYMVRYWESNRRTFHDAVNAEVGYGLDGPPGTFGETLTATFGGRNYLYNVELVHRTDDPGRTESVTMVRQGFPDENAVVASRTVTLYDNQTLTAPGSGTAELHEYDTDFGDGDDGYYPVPDAVEGPVYNVVEVRLIVW